jgi:hypothetical protein
MRILMRPMRGYVKGLAQKNAPSRKCPEDHMSRNEQSGPKVKAIAGRVIRMNRVQLAAYVLTNFADVIALAASVLSQAPDHQTKPKASQPGKIG